MKVGDILIERKEVKWRECEECGRPAKYKLTFLLDRFRSNPASSGYRKDDCSRCSDLDIFSCGKCSYILQHAPYGYDSAHGRIPLKNFKHMGFYTALIKDTK